MITSYNRAIGGRAAAKQARETGRGMLTNLSVAYELMPKATTMNELKMIRDRLLKDRHPKDSVTRLFRINRQRILLGCVMYD